MKLLIYLFTMTQLIFAQQFIKITSGDIVNDKGDSRSVNWIDYDNDSDLDLFVSNGPASGENNFFYENNGDGTFRKLTSLAVTQDLAPSDGSSWGDYDNDGDADLFVANWYNINNLLYQNNGDKTFTAVNNTISTSRGYSETGSWGDYDNDGYLDLYVCNSEGTKKNFLYHNNGDGSFTKITTGTPVSDANYSRNADWVDYDNDGYIDLFVTNENGQNENMYHNNGDGTFSSVSIPGVTTSGGNSTSSNWEDIDNDGDWDLFIANYRDQKNFMFRNNGDGSFTKISEGPVVTDPANSFGSSFGDIDNDGDLDLFVTNAFTGSARTINYLYTNDGLGNFTRDDQFSSADSGWAYGCAFGDYDKNGFLDLFVAKCFNAVENNALYRNTNSKGNWLLVNLKGYKSNSSAIGAIVKVKTHVLNDPRWRMRRAAGQNGYCGQNLQMHFGLGIATVIDTIEVQWPSGIRQIMTEIPVNQILNIEEDTTLSAVTHKGENPQGFRLNQNYPNPFNPSTTITFSITDETAVTILKVYDTLGREIRRLFDEYLPAGEYETSFDASDLSSGVYYYNLHCGSFSESRKMIIIK